MENFSYERLSFVVEWYQEEAGLIRIFLFNYFPYDKSVEMFDKKKNKTFLKRVCIADLIERNLYIGAKLNIFGRQVIVTDYADNYTRNKLTNIRQKAFGLIPSKYLPKLGEILKIFCDNGFSISNCAMYELTKQQSEDLANKRGFGVSEIWSSGPTVALIVMGKDAFNRLNFLVAGPEKQRHQITEADLLFGNGAMTDALFCPQTPEDVPKMCDFFFGPGPDGNELNLAKSFEKSTLCLIKPHALIESKCGDILMDIIANGFVIKGLKTFNLGRQNCEEFYEVYNGVCPEYLVRMKQHSTNAQFPKMISCVTQQMVTELSSGPFIALIIGKCSPTEHAYQCFRQLCGPFDPEIAREIRPRTIRARFGVNVIKNAVHCTDLEEDCSNEVEYFFKILSK